MPRVKWSTECDVNQAITAAIKYGMSMSGQNASDLAEAARCDRVTIQRRFNHPGTLTIDELRAISSRIGIPVEKLIVGNIN